MLELAFTPDRESAAPLYRQLGTYLRGLIEAARLPAGGKLPATRELAASLGVSRNTVSQAYEDLIAAGLLTAHVGQGTFVAASVPLATVAAGQTRSRDFVWSGLLALRARALTVPPRLAAAETGRARFDFRGGRVARDVLPTTDVRAAFSAALARLPELASHQAPLGWPPLRRAIARHLVARGITCEWSDVAVVNGAQQAIDLVARVLVDPGDAVVVEEPGYFGAAVAFAAAQANLIGVRVDAEGLRTDELARVLRSRRVKLIAVTPGAQSPTGVVMSERRRRTLLALADEHQVPILEDDYDQELRYEGPPIAALKAHDRAGQVVHAGTFSKVLFPGLRLGYVVAAPPLLEKLALARWNADVATSVLPQAAMAHLLERGALGRHLKRVRRLYTARRAAMLEALAGAMPASVAWTRPSGGHGVWVTLPPGIDGAALLHEALAAGVAYTPGEAFHHDGRGGGHLLLSFATLEPRAIASGVAVLATIVRRLLGRRVRRAS